MKLPLSFRRLTMSLAAGCLLILAGALLAPPLLYAQATPDRAPLQNEPTLAPISETLTRQLRRAERPVSFVVVLADQFDVQAALASEIGAAAADQPTRARLIYRWLSEHAQRTQAPLRAWLEARHIDYQPFYIVNMIEVHGDAALADQLRRRADVARLSANPQVQGTDVINYNIQNSKRN